MINVEMRERQGSVGDRPALEVIKFPKGLLGFPAVREYRLSEGPGTGLFWLSGPEPDSPCFLLSDPFVYFEGLSLDLSQTQVEQIHAHDTAQVAVLAVTVPVETGSWTANLQGPVVINVEERLGAQVVLADQSLGVRRAFRPLLPGPNPTPDPLKPDQAPSHKDEAELVDPRPPSQGGVPKQLLNLRQ